MQKFKVNNLDCANCASKIENSISKLKEVKYVSLNFAESTMFIDTDNIERVRKVIKETEPEVEIVDVSESVKNSKFHSVEKSKLKKEFFLLLAIVVLYVSGILFVKHPVFFIVLYLLSGWEVLFSAAKKILKGKLFDEHFLMSIATLGAIAVNQLPEAAGVMIFYQIGEFLQQLSLKRSRNSIKSLLEVKPSYANLRKNGTIIKTAPENVKINDIIVVKPGEKIPLDGIITEGSSNVDTSPLTGEPVPKLFRPGSNVLAGMINITGSMIVRVTKSFENSSISKMLELVESASSQKAKTEKFISRFSAYYTPFVVGIAIIIAFIPPVFLGGQLSVWVYRALVILVISCPCALVISIPLGYFGGIGSASRKGILVKGSNFLDALTEVTTVIFDKTGTLTKGVFKVTDIVPKNGYGKEDLLRLAAEAEQHSNHPVAKSIRDAYGKHIADQLIEDYQEIPGHGIKARVENKILIAGNDKLLHLENIAHEDCSLNKSVVHLAVNYKYAGYIIISDELKEDARDTIRYLRKAGVSRLLMFTGDNSKIAGSISDELKLDGCYAELLPEEKVKALENIMRNNPAGKIAFIGDGINDAPVLARSDVGIAMGALGSDVAIETADIVIMTDTPSKIGTAIRIAKRTHSIVWQNIIFALAVKAFFITLGSFGVATMWEAVFGDMGVAIIAILNSLRVLK